MKKIFLVLFSINFCLAGILDFYYEYKAKNAYKNGDFKKASEIYLKIQNDKALYNSAVSDYENGDFAIAATKFEMIKDKNLSFEKLHNLGNAYANLNQIQKAINSYENALKIRFDEDTQANLNLMKSKQKEKQYEKAKKQSLDGRGNVQNLKNESGQESSQNSFKTAKNSENLSKSGLQKTNSNENNLKDNFNKFQEQSWQERLKERSIATFMIPLTDKIYDNENPW